MRLSSLSRREFLKISTLALGSLALPSWSRVQNPQITFPQSERLGRVGWYSAKLKEKPDYDSKTVGVLYEDSVVPWLREVVGRIPLRNNQRFVETPEGFIWCREIMPVRNQPNQPITVLPVMGDKQGMWVEVTVPYIDSILDNPPPRSSFFEHLVEIGSPFRFYYSQILWIDSLRVDEAGNTWYRVNERYGNPGDMLWAPAEAFRPLTSEELSPINPEVEDKRIVVHVNWKEQYLSCFEGNTEVYYCRISSGVVSGSTPLSAVGSPGFPIWRKLHSLHMSGGTNAEGWDLPGIGWTSLFHGEGMAIHSTFWHNNFGEPESHGCVNCAPDDAKWIFRWTNPIVPFEAGDNDVTLTGMPSTRITIVES